VDEAEEAITADAAALASALANAEADRMAWLLAYAEA
jgi:hypothetical protein